MQTRDSKQWDLGSIPMIQPEFLGSILATASDIALVVSDTEIVHSILLNESEQNFGNLSHWQGKPIWDFLTVDSVPKLRSALDLIKSGATIMHSIEINHQDQAKWQFPVRYSVHRLGDDGHVLLLGRDLRSVSEIQQQLVEAQLTIERSYEQRREQDVHYKMLFATGVDPVFFVSAFDGRIDDANPAAHALFGVSDGDLRSKNFYDLISHAGSSSDFLESLTAAAVSKTPIDVTLGLDARSAKAMLRPFIYRASGRRIILCRISVAHKAETSENALMTGLMSLYSHGADAIVFTNSDGVIQYANESFLELINVPDFSIIRGRSLVDYLARGQIDLAVMLENVRRSGQMRVYSTKLKNDFGRQTGVEVSISRPDGVDNGYVAFVIRDSIRTEASRNSSDTPNEVQSGAKVSELVGSATLKEIVSETTDIIEKICIETAIDLTGNNRAAAAEMLGLSRQSLYVKLRKLRMINASDE